MYNLTVLFDERKHCLSKLDCFEEVGLDLGSSYFSSDISGMENYAAIVYKNVDLTVLGRNFVYEIGNRFAVY